jgi:hypothetical protein
MIKVKNNLLAVLIFFSMHSTRAQTDVTLSGTISDKATGEGLIGARISAKNLSGVGVVTNEYGFYSLTLRAGSYTVEFSSFGYEVQSKDLDLKESLKLDIELIEPPRLLEEVVVSSRRKDENIRDAQNGVENLDPKQLAKIPVIFGEKDIIKSMQLLPGVKGGGDGSSGFYVRGGSSDQNLILLDEAPVYNASHLLGFFSTFNSDAIKTATIYKGTQPAQYGGRLSSVLDVRMNEGNSKEYRVSGGIGLISSKLNLEGPLVKNRASFLISGRRTYADIFLKLSNKEALRSASLYFYDLNAKVNYKISDRDKLFLSGYFGRDRLGVSNFGLTWGNVTGTARWNHVVTDRLFSNTSFIVSNYLYDIGIESNGSDIIINSTLQDYNLKQEFQYYLNSRNKVQFGCNSIHHSIIPGQIKADATSGANTFLQKPKVSWENSMFASNDWKFCEKIRIIYGVRASLFALLGNDGDHYTYASNGTLASTAIYGKGEVIGTPYFNLEPRINASYAYSRKASIKGGYARNVQNVHLISNSTGDNPTDIWIPSSQTIRPEIADQFTLGWFQNFKENRYELSVESYYKQMSNQIDYRDGANTLANDFLEGELLFGSGRAYGVEVYLKKTFGRFSGWVSYTLSRTEKQIEGINSTNWYAAKQDRTHDVALVGIFDLTKKLSCSGTFVYYTGNAITLPSGKYYLNNQVQWLYTERNGGRMPAYHRMDVALTWIRKQTDKYESSWNFSIYNVYGHENAYSISFRESEDKTKTEAVQTSLFKMIPAISYNFKFL